MKPTPDLRPTVTGTRLLAPPFDPQRYSDIKKCCHQRYLGTTIFEGSSSQLFCLGRVSKPLNLQMNGLCSSEGGMPVSAFDSSEPLPCTASELRSSL
jgi:hypothetical protein